MKKSAGIIDLISKELIDELGILPEIHADHPIEFRLIRAGKVDPSSSKRTSTPQGYIYPGRALIFDPYSKRTILIRNVNGYKPILDPGKETIMDPIEEYIRFPASGSIYCTPEKYDQYVFMMLDNRHRDNPHAKPGKAQYYMVDPKREVVKKNNSFSYKHLATGLVIDLEGQQIAEVALKLKKVFPKKYPMIDLNAPDDKLLATISGVADKDPIDIIVALKEPRSYHRVVADDAVDRKLIVFDDKQSKWKFKKAEKGKETIAKVESGNKPINALVDHLISEEGKEHSAGLCAQFENHYSKSR
jgi:hypothetical protein